MRNLVLLMAIGGVVTFVLSAYVRIANMHILNASAAGWWRASVSLIALGILFALIEIGNELRKRQAS